MLLISCRDSHVYFPPFFLLIGCRFRLSADESNPYRLVVLPAQKTSLPTNKCEIPENHVSHKQAASVRNGFSALF